MRSKPRDAIKGFQGFTLVEILVVIGVVATLGTVVFTASRAMMTRARIIESSSNLRSLVVANENYQADHGYYCPATDQSTNRCWHGTRASPSEKFDTSKGLLSPYLGKSREVNQCPLFKAMVTGGGSFADGTGGYGYNAAYVGGRPGGNYDPLTKLLISARPAQITNPGKTLMFATTAYAREGGLQESPFCEPPFWDFGNGPSANRPSPTLHFRANGKALIAWGDGSVTAETRNSSPAGENPHGGDAIGLALGWAGPEDNNGWWNPQN